MGHSLCTFIPANVGSNGFLLYSSTSTVTGRRRVESARPICHQWTLGTRRQSNEVHTNSVNHMDECRSEKHGAVSRITRTCYISLKCRSRLQCCTLKRIDTCTWKGGNAWLRVGWIWKQMKLIKAEAEGKDAQSRGSCNGQCNLSYRTRTVPQTSLRPMLTAVSAGKPPHHAIPSPSHETIERVTFSYYV